MTIEEILFEIKNICILNNVSKIVLFGSFAKGNNHKTSDIDIAVDGDFDYFELLDEINSINTLRDVDLVDLRDLRNKNLLEDINSYGKILYQQI